MSKDDIVVSAEVVNSIQREFAAILGMFAKVNDRLDVLESKDAKRVQFEASQ